MQKNELKIPWAKLTYWNILFESRYFFRSVSLDVWIASKKTDVEFGELKFGETNLRTIREILKRVPINSDTTVFELGCGRGRAAFMLHFLTGAKIVALDLVGPFIVTGRRLARWMGVEQHILFGYENFLHSDLREADVLYACALCLGQQTREQLVERIAQCSEGTYLISVGWNPQESWLQAIDEFSSKCSWGTATLYIKRVSRQNGESPKSDPPSQFEDDVRPN